MLQIAIHWFFQFISNPSYGVVLVFGHQAGKNGKMD
jgi:hypothetical protein